MGKLVPFMCEGRVIHLQMRATGVEVVYAGIKKDRMFLDPSYVGTEWGTNSPCLFDDRTVGMKDIQDLAVGSIVLADITTEGYVTRARPLPNKLTQNKLG